MVEYAAIHLDGTPFHSSRPYQPSPKSENVFKGKV